MLSKDDVVKIGKRLGFELVRMCSAEPFTDYERTLKERIQAGLYADDLIHHEDMLLHPEEYIDPSADFPCSNTVVSMAFCYHTQETSSSKAKGEPRGVLARAYQRDVYGEKNRRKQKFIEILRGRGIAVSEALLPYKMAAVRAGIGWQGKNSLILNKDYGSWMVLDSIVVDAEYEPDEPLPNECGSCRACQLACPTSAIQSPGVVNTTRCIDYLTCKTGSIPVDLRSKMSNRIVSCDRCQEACPYNRRAKKAKNRIPSRSARFRQNPALLPLLQISEGDFKKHFLDADFIDPRLEYLQRNVIVALGNIRDPIAVPTLKRFLHDGTQLVKEHAAWALARIDKAQ